MQVALAKLHARTAYKPRPPGTPGSARKAHAHGDREESPSRDGRTGKTRECAGAIGAQNIIVGCFASCLRVRTQRELI